MGNILFIFKRLKSMDKKAMLDTIDKVKKETGKSRISIFLDMQKCARRYGAGYSDYYLLEFYNKTEQQRNTYLTRGRNNSLCLKYCDMDYAHYFVNKTEFNEKFNEYLKRDWINVNGTKKEKIIEFFKKHETFMAKPIDGFSGQGIEKIKTSSYKSYDELYEYLTKDGANYELEEVIKQHSEVSKIYPDSINTIRVVTIVTTEDDKPLISLPNEERKNAKLKCRVIFACCRIGNGKCVDNFGNGGMVAPVDVETGIISAVAIDKQKNVYEKHPKTGYGIKGFKFPYWNEVLEMCKKASFEIPEMGYTGWDVAITPEGPVFVEGNELPGYNLYQMPVHTPDKIGVMAKFDFMNKDKYIVKDNK